MIPVTFNGCFGWLHAGCGLNGVVLCSALGHEEMTAYRGWRQLAEKLALQGFHVLRFDYSGTGDSLGTEEDPDRVETWRNDIVAATHHLRLVSGSKNITLIGLRLGATLAFLASEILDYVKDVVLLAPVLNGKSYIRQLRLQDSGWREANLQTVNKQQTSYLEVYGNRLSAPTIKSISQIKIEDIQPDLQNVLIMVPQDQGVDSNSLSHIEAAGCRLYIEAFVGYKDYIESPITSIVPQKEFNQISDWCCQVSSVQRLSINNRGSNKSIAVTTDLFYQKDFTEKATYFGSDKSIFGILCCPKQIKKQYTPSFIMLNTGFGRHVGDGRIFTTLARRLAALGLASLRMDLVGFGDSDTDDHDLNPYVVDSAKNVGSAVSLLKRLGYDDPHLIGVCSGAFNVFHAAVNDTRIRSVIMINIQAFIWKKGSSLLVENRRQRRTLKFYTKVITRPQAWKRIYHGEVAVGSILIALCQRPWMKLHRKILMMLENITGVPTSAGQVGRWFDTMTNRGVRLELIYTEGDPGLENLSLHFGRLGRKLRRNVNTNVHIIENADHALFDYSARSRVMEMITSSISR